MHIAFNARAHAHGLSRAVDTDSTLPMFITPRELTVTAHGALLMKRQRPGEGLQRALQMEAGIMFAHVC